MQNTFNALQNAARSLHGDAQWGSHWKNPGLYARLWWHGLLNFRIVSRLQADVQPGQMSQRLVEEPHFLGVLVWPLVDLRWTPKRRLQELIAHYREAASLGSLLDLHLKQTKPLLNLDSVQETLEVRIERQPWFSREGQAALSLFLGGERVYSVAFLLSRTNGQRIAYIGAIQGVKQGEDSTVDKQLTKAAHGMRPRDLNLSMFLLLCEAMQVERVLPVADRHRQHQHAYFGKSKEAELFVNYDTVWAENGATALADGQWSLEPGIRIRDLQEVPSRKRAMYRRRAELLATSLQGFKEQVRASRLAPVAKPNRVHAARYGTNSGAPSTLRRHYNGLVDLARPGVIGTWLWCLPTIF